LSYLLSEPRGKGKFASRFVNGSPAIFFRQSVPETHAPGSLWWASRAQDVGVSLARYGLQACCVQTPSGGVQMPHDSLQQT